MSKAMILLCVGVMLILSHSVAGALVGPIFPPPGGVSYSTSGDSGLSGGFTLRFYDLNLAASENLYWGLSSDSFVGLSLNSVGASVYLGSEIMTFSDSLSSLSAGTAVWTGSSTLGWYSPTGQWNQATIDTRFTLKVTNDDGTPVSLSGAVGVGLPASVGAVAFIDSSIFKANLLFECRDPYDGVFKPARELFQSSRYTNHGVGQYKDYASNFYGGFYYSPLTYSILGHARLADFVGDCTTHTVHAVLKQGTTVVRDEYVNMDQGELFRIDGLESGVYQGWFKVDHWLAVSKADVNVAYNLYIGELQFVNGDCDGDNEITSTDLSVLALALGSTPSDANWNAVADLDGDGEVTSTDLSILGLGLGQIGDN